jgi:Ca2+-binding EF-hand superfamily protein
MKKADQLFALYDADRDGFISRDDHAARLERLAVELGWGDRDPLRLRGAAYLERRWAEICQAVDKDSDDRISLEEYRSQFASGEAHVLETADLWFDLLDADGDGELRLADYERLLRVFGADTATAERDFSNLTDGRNSADRGLIRSIHQRYRRSGEDAGEVPILGTSPT